MSRRCAVVRELGVQQPYDRIVSLLRCREPLLGLCGLGGVRLLASNWLWIEPNRIVRSHAFLALDTLKKQVQNQVFSCMGKKRNPLDFNESDTRYESRFPLQIFFYRLLLKYVETKERDFGLFFLFQ
jgi:hypothetical protein